MKKILYIPTLNLGVIYWRIEMYAQYMVQLSDECDVFVEYFVDPNEPYSWESICLEGGEKSEEIQNKLRAAFKHFDYIIIQKLQYKDSIALVQKMKEEFPDTKVIAEIDDSIGDVSSDNPNNFRDAHKWAAEHVNMSDGVIVSTDYLRDSILYMFPEKLVHVAKNCINYSVWEPKPRNVHKTDVGPIPKRLIKCGYVGGYAHDRDLEIAYGAIKETLEKNKDFYFIVRYGGFRPDFLEEHPRIDFKQVSWHTSKYPSKLMEMDVDFAIAPLQDTKFNRCKSSIKWLEWASLNVPCICSKVEAYKDVPQAIITENSKESWINSIETAYDSVKKKDPLFKGVVSLSEIAREKYNIKEECEEVFKFLDKL